MNSKRSPGDTISEAELQVHVTGFATRCGWKWWHFHDSRRQVTRKDGHKVIIGDKDAAGFPDLCMCHPTRGVLFLELKGPKTPITPEQVRSLDRLAEAAMSMSLSGPGPRTRVHLWRPADFPTVGAAVLSRGVGPIVYGDWAGH